ncbi:MAG: DUF2252 domain-containing protein [Acidimicrobiia bacterium]|nr:DUF2252 domain-containing protein [Acidimicrobiia bacterium]
MMHESTQHLTVDERKARGKAARAEVPRSAHARWEPFAHRPDPVDLLEEQAESRVAELVPIRYGRMLVSPFTFFRGAAYLMASDLATGPRTGLHTQLCGDAHLSNFGFFGSPDRHIVFSLNDFDETHPGPFEWDVKRLAASFAVAGRDRGFHAKQRRRITSVGVRAYRTAMTSFAAMGNFDVWYARLTIEDIVERYFGEVSEKRQARFEKNIAKARAKDSLKAFDKLTELVDGEPRIVSDPPLVVPLRELVAEDEPERLDGFIREQLDSYRETLPGNRRRLVERYRYVDGARKVVGVGSVGTRAYIVVLVGRDDADPLVLQFKEAQPSVLEPFLGRGDYESHGQRVVEGQRLMQAASDVLIGWISSEGLDGVRRDFYVRQLWDNKASADVETFSRKTMTAYAELCGWTLARAHARSGDPIAIASYLGSGDNFDRAIASWAELYADQNERDYTALQDAVATGRVIAETGF